MCNFGGDFIGIVLEGKSNAVCEIFNLFVNIKCRINTREGDGGAVTAIPLEIVPEKEERLLPPPYQTNCRDNGPSDAVEKFTNPNSYQICQEMCRSELSKEMYGCDYGMTMQLSTNHLCHEDGDTMVILKKKFQLTLEHLHVVAPEIIAEFSEIKKTGHIHL
ncbi:hypothetical protein AVEN_111420-1 [Araneus ventricosus]|uniref:Uncharacterized protein n=1 Tax=Araneus ventricosus TaxID=182803 RepID=A0A4Y2UG91_ARAVE|nr:hypothetical protein AVEN_111420-1 [Araneus ventricosus]